MADDEMSLGGVALLRNRGNPNAALADLMTQVVGMCGFIHVSGVPQDVVLEAFDAMTVSSREALVGIMEEDSRGTR